MGHASRLSYGQSFLKSFLNSNHEFKTNSFVEKNAPIEALWQAFTRH